MSINDLVVDLIEVLNKKLEAEEEAMKGTLPESLDYYKAYFRKEMINSQIEKLTRDGNEIMAKLTRGTKGKQFVSY